MLENHFLHLVAIGLLFSKPPLEAKGSLFVIARRLPRLSVDEARRVAARLRGGTCLSKALTVASRLDGAEIVIGKGASGAGEAKGFFAHAWVERGGELITAREGSFGELGRLR